MDVMEEGIASSAAYPQQSQPWEDLDDLIFGGDSWLISDR